MSASLIMAAFYLYFSGALRVILIKILLLWALKKKVTSYSLFIPLSGHTSSYIFLFTKMNISLIVCLSYAGVNRSQNPDAAFKEIHGYTKQ